MDANAPTIYGLLRLFFSESEIMAGLKRVVEAVAAVIDRMPAIIERALVPARQMVEQIDKLPPVPGYEPLLIERGHHPIIARGFAYVWIGLSERVVDEVKMQRTLVDAVRFLAKPNRRKRAISRRAAVLLDYWKIKSNLGTIFDGVDISEFRFVELLEAVARGDHAASQRVTEIAAVLAPRLSVPRGRKASAPSIAHELLLLHFCNMTGPKIYTWDLTFEDFTDPLTHATRMAFGDPDFDPRSARRRQRDRLRLKSN